jgi:hypothetical protein
MMSLSCGLDYPEACNRCPGFWHPKEACYREWLGKEMKLSSILYYTGAPKTQAHR